MSRLRRPTLADLPAFATDRELGAALLGPERATEFTAIAPLLERKGLPKVDQLFGGRYVPAVKTFLDQRAGIGEATPGVRAPDEVEDWNQWATRKRPGRRA
jgi:hypothetical protein